MALTLLRHTAPAVIEGTCYGRLDLDLAASFEQELRALSARLPDFEQIISSPLQRCRQLADRLASARGLAVKIDDQLIEMDFGSWEGRLWSELPRTELDAWAGDFLHARPHGGESVAMLHKRVQAATHRHAGAASNTLIVTHAGVIRAAFASRLEESMFQTQVSFGHHITLDPADRETVCDRTKP